MAQYSKEKNDETVRDSPYILFTQAFSLEAIMLWFLQTLVGYSTPVLSNGNIMWTTNTILNLGASFKNSIWMMYYTM